MQVVSGKDYVELWSWSIYQRGFNNSLSLDWAHVAVDEINNLQTSWSSSFSQVMVF